MDRHEERKFINEQEQQYAANLEPAERYERSLEIMDVSRKCLGEIWKNVLQEKISRDTLEASVEARESYIRDFEEFLQARLQYLEHTGTVPNFETQQSKLFYSFLGETGQRTKIENEALNHQSFFKKVGSLILQPFSSQESNDSPFFIIQYDQKHLKEWWEHRIAPVKNKMQTYEPQAEKDAGEGLVAVGVDLTEKFLNEEYVVLFEEFDRRNGLEEHTI